jgi:cytochrome c55X
MDASREKELVRLVREECGSCHGLTLKGGLGPSLLPDALKDKPDEFLMLTLLQGRLGTPMPPWAPFMTETEASWIVNRLKSGFPEK